MPLKPVLLIFFLYLRFQLKCFQLYSKSSSVPSDAELIECRVMTCVQIKSREDLGCVICVDQEALSVF